MSNDSHSHAPPYAFIVRAMSPLNVWDHKNKRWTPKPAFLRCAYTNSGSALRALNAMARLFPHKFADGRAHVRPLKQLLIEHPEIFQPILPGKQIYYHLASSVKKAS